MANQLPAKPAAGCYYLFVFMWLVSHTKTQLLIKIKCHPYVIRGTKYFPTSICFYKYSKNPWIPEGAGLDLRGQLLVAPAPAMPLFI
jgi:hypothetical protein